MFGLSEDLSSDKYIFNCDWGKNKNANTKISKAFRYFPFLTNPWDFTESLLNPYNLPGG